MAREIHVVPFKTSYKNAWIIKFTGGGWSKKYTKENIIYGTKKVAVDVARRFSINNRVELVVHNLDGKIAKKDSHGNDLRRSRG